VSASAGAVHADLLSGMRLSRQAVDNIATAGDEAARGVEDPGQALQDGRGSEREDGRDPGAHAGLHDGGLRHGQAVHGRRAAARRHRRKDLQAGQGTREGAQGAGGCPQGGAGLQGKLELAFRAAIDAVGESNPSQIERELWIQFISTLQFGEATAILDDNDIEERLNALGLQGPDSPIGFNPIGDTDAEDTWEVPLKARIYQLRREIVGKRGTIQGSQVLVDGRSFEASVPGDPADGAAVDVVDVTRRAKGRVDYGEDAGILVVCTPAPPDPETGTAAPEAVPAGVAP